MCVCVHLYMHVSSGLRTFFFLHRDVTFECEERIEDGERGIDVKGKGRVITYWITGAVQKCQDAKVAPEQQGSEDIEHTSNTRNTRNTRNARNILPTVSFEDV